MVNQDFCEYFVTSFTKIVFSRVTHHLFLIVRNQQSRVILAPFFKVGFADFWLADQLNSLVPVFMDFQYFACFYTSSFNSNSWFEKRGKDTLQE
jgi:hypothetical protein